MERPYNVLVVTMWFINLKTAVCPVASVLYREGKEEVGAISCGMLRKRKSPLQKKEKPYMAVDISQTFTQTIPTDMILSLCSSIY
ncbi:MAG: hypothetical protein AB4080_06960 [Trichodesmium sp.]